MRIEKIGNITFILGDCMEFLEGQKDNSFDLAIIDPPYGINISNNIGRRKGQKSSNYKKVTWDNSAPNSLYFNNLFQVSKNQIIWGANHFIDKIPINSSAWLVWDKKFSDDVSFANCELAWSSFDFSVKRKIIHPKKVNAIHPTQKPVQLYKWQLKKFANPGDKILDTHGGSGSIAIACYKLGFELTIIEKDEDYFNAMLKRFKLETAQKQLF